MRKRIAVAVALWLALAAFCFGMWLDVTAVAEAFAVVCCVLTLALMGTLTVLWVRDA